MIFEEWKDFTPSFDLIINDQLEQCVVVVIVVLRMRR